jgi:hypothetical protein
MAFTIDPNLYTQIGLDSGSLTMLGSVVHSLGEPGQYRVALHRGEVTEGVCFITADKNSPASQVTIDIASLTGSAAPAPSGSPVDKDCCCGDGGKGSGDGQTFTVNPKGYVLFRVSGGAGGYYVHVRRIDAAQTDKGYDSRVLGEGDLFSAVILRPGTYSVSNSLTKAKGEIVVPYPKIGDKAYVPPPPVRVICGERTLDPPKLQVHPGQGVIFEAKAASRIAVKLEKPDDGPGGAQTASRVGLRRTKLK